MKLWKEIKSSCEEIEDNIFETTDSMFFSSSRNKNLHSAVLPGYFTVNVETYRFCNYFIVEQVATRWAKVKVSVEHFGE